MKFFRKEESLFLKHTNWRGVPTRQAKPTNNASVFMKR